MRKIYVITVLLCVVMVFSSSRTDDGTGSCSGANGDRKSAGPGGCYSAEPPGNYTCGETDCHTDHAVNSGSAFLNLYLGGADSAYVPGQTYTITVSLRKSGLVRGGFQIIALKDGDPTLSPGTITLTDATRMQILDAANIHGGPCLPQNKKWVEHTGDGIDQVSGDSIQWQFNWQAPATPMDVTFYAGAVEANNDLESTGDYVYTARKSTKGPEISSVDKIGGNGISVYPSPFTEQIEVNTDNNIQYGYKIYDAAGKLLQTGYVAGIKGTISASMLKAGIYFLVLESDGQRFVKRIIKI